jgi:hypothetical protein
MAGLSILKHTHDVFDEELCARWIENRCDQQFCGQEFFVHKPPFDRASLARRRQRMGDEKLVALIQESLNAAARTSVQPKAVAFPTDAKLMHRARELLARLARKHGVTLRQSYARVGERALRSVRTHLGPVFRDIHAQNQERHEPAPRLRRAGVTRLPRAMLTDARDAALAKVG